MPTQHELQRRPRTEIPKRLQTTPSIDVFTAPRIRRRTPTRERRLKEKETSREYLGVGERQRRVVLAGIRPNDELSDFAYSTTYSEKLTLDVYADKFVGVEDPKKRKKKIKNNQGAAYQSIQSFIGKLEKIDTLSPKVAERIKNIVEEIRASNPYYADLTVEQIISMLQRKRSPLGVGNREKDITLFLPDRIEDFHILSGGELTAYLLMLSNDEGTEFRYQNAQTALTNFYTDYKEEISNLSAGRKRSLRIHYAQNADADLNDFIKDLEGYEDLVDQDKKPPLNLRRFMFWMSQQPVYEGFSPDDIIEVLRRKISFSEIRDAHIKEHYPKSQQRMFFAYYEHRRGPNEIRLSGSEKYLLARLIYSVGNSSQEQSFGIHVLEDDKEVLTEVISSQVAKDVNIGLSKEDQLRQQLRARLAAFFQDPEGFMQKIVDEETRYMLSIIRNGHAKRLLGILAA